ncbi:MAG TPA: tyrosine-type recombinase/integrase [Candidatus Dormibacteraeota bacterium]|nr:tyrosine-type recombinase/integrase [Candidatus Dormibacteraeota bacterium]
MTFLRRALIDYLAVRRRLGYRLARAEKLLAQFLTYLQARGEAHVRTATALAWATLSRRGGPNWASYRLSVVRAFATHLRALDPATEAPPPALLPWRPCRATPYLYSDEDVAAVLAAAGTLRTPHRVATYRTVIGLLAVTGMRVGEALALDCRDVDVTSGRVVIRRGKFGKARELPLHASTVAALRTYLDRRDRPRAATPALFVSLAGTRLRYDCVHLTFHQLVRRAGLAARSARCRPRPHDLRHSFAVRTLLDGYRGGGDPVRRLSLLSTYLGHVDPAHTYWYLSAAPELLALAAARLERHLRRAP